MISPTASNKILIGNQSQILQMQQRKINQTMSYKQPKVFVGATITSPTTQPAAIKQINPSSSNKKIIPETFSLSKFSQRLSGSKLNIPRLDSSNIINSPNNITSPHNFNGFLGGGLNPLSNGNNMNNKSNNRIPSFSSQATIPNTENGLLSIDGRIITVKIRSNWGDPEKVVLPQIHITDDKRKMIEVMNISTIPTFDSVNGAQSSKKLTTLVDPTLLKTENEFLSMKFPNDLSDDATISVIIFLNPDIYPKYMRIWNQSHCGDASVRDVSVTDGSELCFAGEIPREFGANFELHSSMDLNTKMNFTKKMICSQKSSEVLSTLFPNLMPEKGYTDIYGIYPFKHIKTLSFEIKSTYVKENFIGLNGIEVFDTSNKMILYDDFEDIKLEGFTTFIDPKKLFRLDKKTTDWNLMYLVETKWEKNPIITIIFKKKVYISKIVIWNFNAEKRNLKFGVSKMAIRGDNQLLWCGKVRIGTGALNGIAQNTTEVWTTDVKEIREKDFYL